MIIKKKILVSVCVIAAVLAVALIVLFAGKPCCCAEIRRKSPFERRILHSRRAPTASIS